MSHQATPLSVVLQDPAALARFWAKVKKSPRCWLWTGTVSGTGYGVIKAHGKMWFAHRIAFAAAFGPFFPALCVCHACDTPLCVRPDHLFLGTTQDNTKDRDAKGRKAAGDRSGRRKHPSAYPAGRGWPWAKLTDDAVRSIRARHAAGGVSYRQLAREYSVSKHTIYLVIKGLKWRHLLDGADPAAPPGG